ncbi:MAG TPA: RNA methyltransferase [Candidatus Saccharimonadales bacterium]|nr:RNA methyltransferase [Candidatus Saccharimonadales bacterium]
MTPVITSKQNPKVKALLHLRKRRDRDEAGLFIIEGYREVRRALDKKIPFVELYYSPDWFLGENEPAVIAQARNSGATLYELSKDVFDKCSYRDRPDGLLAVARQWQTSLSDLPLNKNPFLIIVESIEKPGNLGTILRSADGAGADAVIVCDPVTDIFNPNVVRASTGVLFSVPVAVADSKSVHAWLQKNKIKIVSTTPDTSLLYTNADFTGPVAIVMGSEQYGLSDFWLDQKDDILVRIPMAGQADSLNVATATVLVAYEVVRQRTILSN